MPIVVAAGGLVVSAFALGPALINRRLQGLDTLLHEAETAPPPQLTWIPCCGESASNMNPAVTMDEPAACWPGLFGEEPGVCDIIPMLAATRVMTTGLRVRLHSRIAGALIMSRRYRIRSNMGPVT